MRIALYDARSLTALTTIEFPDALLHATRPAETEIILLPLDRMPITIRTQAIRTHIVNEQKIPAATYVACATDEASCSWIRFALFDTEKTPEPVPPQHIPHAQRAIRSALKMGEAA